MTHNKLCNAPRHDSYMGMVPSPTTTGRHLMMQQKHHITIEYKVMKRLVQGVNKSLENVKEFKERNFRFEIKGRD
jgi:hypothetical protein